VSDPEQSAAVPVIVIDTNVTLDWLVFRDPGIAALAAAVESAAVRWHACAAMRDELVRALGYTTLARWSPDSERVLSAFDRWALIFDAPPASNLRCSDRDDQVFIDLALAARARWLVTHDKALLRLGRPARARGVHIVRPLDWRLN
jgi:putative PIN family toxin of toxin-antitoxin system